MWLVVPISTWQATQSQQQQPGPAAPLKRLRPSGSSLKAALSPWRTATAHGLGSWWFFHVLSCSFTSKGVEFLWHSFHTVPVPGHNVVCQCWVPERVLPGCGFPQRSGCRCPCRIQFDLDIFWLLFCCWLNVPESWRRDCGLPYSLVCLFKSRASTDETAKSSSSSVSSEV